MAHRLKRTSRIRVKQVFYATPEVIGFIRSVLAHPLPGYRLDVSKSQLIVNCILSSPYFLKHEQRQREETRYGRL